MCGIFGIIDFNAPAGPDRRTVERCRDLMAHRGPDGRGSWIGPFAGLGHRRLAVIDPLGSPQPMASSDRRFVMTYNGELYNYREMRRELEDEGVRFATSGDTEVVLQALIMWGEEALPRFNGMFAFGMWDCRERSLLLARDRLGVKPLFYAHRGDRLAFASEYPPLLTLDWVDGGPDPVGVVGYLSHYQTTFAGRTIYKGISSLDGGQSARFTPEGLKVGRYWRLPIIPSSEKRAVWSDQRLPEATEEVRRLMVQAVESHCVADVEVGAFLSGGLDSAVVTTLMAEAPGDRVRAYSIGFAEEGFNEFEFSRPLVADLKLRHELITLPQGDYFPLLDDLIALKGAPLSTPNEVPIYALARHTVRDLKVVLTGEGADELFGGYAALIRSPYDLEASQQLREAPEGFPADIRVKLRAALWRLYGRSGLSGELDHWATVYAWLSRSDLDAVLGEQWWNGEVRETLDGFWRERFSALEGLWPGDRYLYLLETEHLRGLLTRLDACTMAGSLEGRVPFTDNRLVEFVWGLPFEFKLRWNSLEAMQQAVGLNSLEIAEQLDTAKFILKEAFREALPAGITARRKRAFPVPLEVWMKGEGSRYVAGELAAAARGGSSILKPGTAKWAERELATGMGALKVFMIWNLAKWQRTL